MPAPQVAVGAQALRELEILIVGRHVTGLDRRSVGDGGGEGPRAFAQPRQHLAVDRFALRDNISAAMPETIGAEKLVPRLLLIWSVKV